MGMIMKITPLFFLVLLVECESYSLQRLAQNVANNIDTDKDGFISGAEIEHDLNTRFDKNNDNCTDMGEFVAQWVYDYHDNIHDSTVLFSIFDKNKDGCMDLTDIALYLPIMDANKDHRVSDAEFENWLMQLHPQNAHGGSGHGQAIVG